MDEDRLVIHPLLMNVPFRFPAHRLPALGLRRIRLVKIIKGKNINAYGNNSLKDGRARDAYWNFTSIIT
jgi:hypothetical protein